MSQISKRISQGYSCTEAEFLKIISHLRGTQQGAGSHAHGNWSVHCPAHDDQKRSASFKWESPDKLITKCFAGCSHQAIMEALFVQGLVSERMSSKDKPSKPETSSFQVTPARLKALWEACEVNTARSPVEEYLTRRIPNLAFLPSCESVRYHSALLHRESGKELPAMVSRVQFQKSDRIAIHRTWLDPNTHQKADVSNPKMMMGSVKGGAVHLSSHSNPEILAIGEGIETMLSFHHMTGISSWAALSASNLGVCELPALPNARVLVIAIDNDKNDASLKNARRLQSRALAEGRVAIIVRPPRTLISEHSKEGTEESIQETAFQFKDFNDIVAQQDWQSRTLAHWIESQDGDDISWIVEKTNDVERICEKFLEEHTSISTHSSIESAHQSLSFDEAFDHIQNTRHNICLLGAGGTGKSTLIQKLMSEGALSGHTVLLAPTGLAALNIGGETIHKFFHFSPDITPHTVRVSKDKIYREIDTIIIDEVSMLRADLLDVIDIFLKKNGKSNTKPFGGVRMILCGDFFQLPPVLKDIDVKEFQEGGYKTTYAFGARSFEGIECIEMNHVFRQKDEAFLNLLKKIRCADIEPCDLAPLNARVQDPEIFLQEGLAPLLTTTNKKADSFNQEKLESIDASAFVYEAKLKNWDGHAEPAPQNLILKTGALVMFLNNDPAGRWVNGTFGVVSDLSKSSITVKIGETEVDVERHTWERKSTRLHKKEIQRKTEGEFTQYPLQLAWSITIHKSQGQTFDRVVIDWDKGTFADGQAYVALSRCRTLEGICFQSSTWPEHLSVSEDVITFMSEARETETIQSHSLSFEGTIHDQDETLYSHQEDESDVVDEDKRFKVNEYGIFTRESGSAHWVQIHGHPLRLQSRFQMEDGSGCGKIFEFENKPFGKKNFVLFDRMINTRDSIEIQEGLRDLGYKTPQDPAQMKLLVQFLDAWDTPHVLTLSEKTGWVGQKSFILNGRSYGEETESYIFKPRSFAIPQYEMKGTLEGWKQEVGVYCEGNSRLMLYVIAALSAPFLKITHRQGFGVHLYGTSSVGKTTTLEVASSVFGSKIHTWRTTDNAAETLVLQSNDAPFLIDELGQADAGSAYNMAYMLSNGETKNRANKLGKNGNTAVSFRTVFLSGGEIPFETKFKERQKEKTAGQSVRCIELRADAGCDKGAFNTVHEFGTPDQFVLHLKEAVHRHYGVASEALLHHLTTADHEEIEMKIREDIRFWKERHLEALLKVTETSDGQILRVGENFAFLASIGEYCIDLGILPWNAGSAFEMMGSLFESWIEDRGGTLPHELLQVEKRLRLLIYQESDRFEAEDEDMTFTSRPISKRAGIRLKKKSEEKTYYCIFTDVMDDEVLKGADKKMALSFLIKKEILISPLKDRYTTQVRMKSFGLNSHAGSYKINPNML